MSTVITGALTFRDGRGAVYVWAAGNGGFDSDSCSYDGYINSIYTLAISSISKFDESPGYGEKCSPIIAVTYSSSSTGDGLTTSYPDHRCTYGMGGTSGSAAIASGIIALVLQGAVNTEVLEITDKMPITYDLQVKPAALRCQNLKKQPAPIAWAPKCSWKGLQPYP